MSCAGQSADFCCITARACWQLACTRAFPSSDARVIRALGYIVFGLPVFFAFRFYGHEICNSSVRFSLLLGRDL